MDLASFKDMLVPIASAVGIISTSVAALLALRDYKLKLQAETRLADASKVEVDIKLVKIFVELMDVANARGPSQLMSDKLFEAVWPHAQKAGRKDPLDVAIVTMPIGSAAQDAAMAAVATLGLKHPLLQPAAEQALKSLSQIKPKVAEEHLRGFQRQT